MLTALIFTNPPAPVAPEGQLVAPQINATHTAWIKGSKEIARLMLMTMEPEIQRNLENLHAYEMLQELKTLFAQRAEQELLQTTRGSLKNKKLSQGASGSGFFTIELYTFPNKSWVYDTGCGTHICNTTQGLRASRKLKHFKLVRGQ
ncbi:hypothetical protein Tco_0610373, partial [Tanacetum coccineum]